MSDQAKQVPSRITSVESAIAWLEAKGHAVELRPCGERMDVQRVCSRCGGSGRYSFNLTHGDRCFGCMGGRSRWVEAVNVIDHARALRNAETAQARAAKKRAAKVEQNLERQRDWCEANGYGRVTFEEKNAKLKAQRQAEREAKRGVAPEGRHVFEGRIIKLDEREGFRGEWVIKATIVVEAEDGTEWLAWGTLPGSVVKDAERGSMVRLTATLSQGREPHFAFFKRPTGAELLDDRHEEHDEKHEA